MIQGTSITRQGRLQDQACKTHRKVRQDDKAREDKDKNKTRRDNIPTCSVAAETFTVVSGLRNNCWPRFEILDITRQDTTRQGKARQDKTRHDKARQDKTRHDKARQDKTRQDKTRQDKTK